MSKELRLGQDNAQSLLNLIAEARASLDARADEDESGDCAEVAEKLDGLLRNLEHRTGLSGELK